MKTIYLSRDKGRLSPPSITFFDFESTSHEPAIAEIVTGYFKTVDAQTGLFIDELRVKSRPNKWSVQAEEIHKIPYEEAMTYPDKKVMMREIFRYLKKHTETLLICHANYVTFGIRGYYDWQIIKTECLYMDILHHFNEFFGKMEVYSTHTMAKDRKLPLRNFSLSNCANFIGFDFKAHDCEEDVKATEALFWYLLEDNNLLTLMEE